MGHIIGIIVGAIIGFLALALFTEGVQIFGYIIVVALCGAIGFIVYERLFSKPKNQN